MASQVQSTDLAATEDLRILDLKQRCLVLFEQCVSHKDINFSTSAQGMRQMLQLWSRHSWVDSRPGMSMDDRLKGHTDLRVTIVGLLELIEQELTKALSSPADNANVGVSAPTTRSNDVMDSEEAQIRLKWESYEGRTWEAVSAAIGMLIELTAMIRKSMVLTWNSTSTIAFPRPDDYFERYFKVLVRNWFPNARESLTDQLGDSIFVRRRHMIYILMHEEKISYARTNMPAGPDHNASKLSADGQKIQLSSQNPLQPNLPRHLDSSVPIFAGASPPSTNLGPLRNDRLGHLRAGRAVSGITEGSVSNHETNFSHMYPEPPKVNGQPHTVCPYCSDFLSKKDLEEKAWKKHLHGDLRPYVCLSEHCRTPVKSYANSERWTQHMIHSHGTDWSQKVHMKTWYCDEEHDMMEFNTEKKLRKHLIEQHRSLSETLVDALVRSNWDMGYREKHVCPLCEAVPPNLNMKLNEQDKASHLVSHIGDHFKALALFSLPSLSAGTGDVETQSSQGAMGSAQSGTVHEFGARHSALVESQGSAKSSLNFDENPHHDVVTGTTPSDSSVSEPAESQENDATSTWPNQLPLHGLSAESQIPLPSSNILTARFILQNRSPALHQHPSNSEYLAVNKIFRYSQDDLVRATLISASKETPTIKEKDIEMYVIYVTRRARRIFLLLVCIEKLGCIFDFCHIGLTDDDLPLFAVDNGQATIVRDSRNHHWRCFDKWGAFAQKTFMDYQWFFLAMPFSTTTFENYFHEKQPLDFRVVDGSGGGGGFSMVRKMEIPIGRDVSAQYRIIAAKLLLSDNDGESARFYNKEKVTLLKMRQLNHRHLIQANAAFERGSTRGFIFPWADGGNLSDVWRKEDTSLNDAGLLTWALSQMEGLIDGIAALAATKTRHGDLKPANILCFPNSLDDDRGILKVADVGLAKYYREYTSKRVVPTTAKFESRRYMPPEATLERVIYSRKYDMWSFGCVLLEFLIWLSLGRQRLLDFVAAATFNSETIPLWENRPFRVSDLAREWIGYVSNALRRAPKQTRALGDILDLIQNRLLRIDIDDRADAQEALQHIQEARRKYHAPTKAKADPSDLSGASDRAMLTAQAGSTDEQQRGQFSPFHFFLSPRFDIPASGGGVVLGRIIVDPQNPGSGIPGCSVVTVPQSAIYKAEVNDWQASMERTHSGFLALWAKFKEVPGGESSGNPKSSSEKQTFSASTLETTYFLPDDEYIAQAVETPGFQEFLEAHEWRRPAFMITGIKIAKGLTISENDRIASPQLDGAEMVNTGVDVGAEVVVARQKTYPTSGDIIFAYSLTRIQPKGRNFFKGRKFVTTEEHGNNEGTARTGINVRDVFDIKEETKEGDEYI